jgi:mRNA-degrading endonuclease RelE of RelBE toxin-antitoxin system
MSWVCKLSREAVKQLRRLPQGRQKQLVQAIAEMEEDPTNGDVRPIRSGKFKGTLRKRVGRHRIVFSLNPLMNCVEIAGILVRTEKTYATKP